MCHLSEFSKWISVSGITIHEYNPWIALRLFNLVHACTMNFSSLIFSVSLKSWHTTLVSILKGLEGIFSPLFRITKKRRIQSGSLMASWVHLRSLRWRLEFLLPCMCVKQAHSFVWLHKLWWGFCFAMTPSVTVLRPASSCVNDGGREGCSICVCCLHSIQLPNVVWQAIRKSNGKMLCYYNRLTVTVNKIDYGRLKLSNSIFQWFFNLEIFFFIPLPTQWYGWASCLGQDGRHVRTFDSVGRDI